MKKYIFACAVLFMTMNITTVTAAETTQASQESIEKLMRVTGAAHTGTQMLGRMKKMMPGISGALWDKFLAQVKVEELTALIVPIYKKHLTQEDVDAMITFYATPTGKKLINTMPAIMQESMITGQRWGQGIAYKLIQMQQAESAKKK